MDQLSELVRDFKLETIALDNFETVHEYPERHPSSRLERWVQVKELGHGAFGSVRLQRRVAENQTNSQLRAVKQITLRPTENIDYSSELEAIVKFSLQKYEACFVKCFGWYETPGSIFIAMEYLEVGDLEKYLIQSRRSKLPEQEVQLIVRQIVQGLTLMHQNRFAHRDLKLKNILVKSHPPSPNGWWVKIADFGISKRFRDGYQLTSVVGTPGYMAPEMWEFTERGSPYALDIWAVGEIAYRLLTGRPAFEKLRQLKSFTDQDLPFPESPLYDAGVSSTGIKFMVSAMCPAPTERMSAKQALNDQWMQFLLPVSEPSSARFTTEGSWFTKASASWSNPEEQSKLRPGADQESTAASAQAHEILALIDGTKSGGDASSSTAIREMSNDLSTSIVTESDRRSPNLSNITSWEQTISEEIVQPLREARNKSSQDLNGSPKAAPNIPIEQETGGLYEDSIRSSHQGQTPIEVSVQNTGEQECGPVCAIYFASDGKMLALTSPTTGRVVDPTTTELCRFSICEESSFDNKLPWPSHSDSSAVIGKNSADFPHKRPLHDGYWHIGLDGYWVIRKRNKKLAISPDGKLISAVSEQTNTIILCDVDLNISTNLGGHYGSVTAIVFSPCGRFIASASSDRTVCLWSVDTRKPHRILRDFSFTVSEVAFSPDGEQLATLCGCYITVWDSQTGEMKHSLRDQRFFIRDATFASDGRSILSISNGVVQAWDLAQETLLARFQAGHHRPFVEEEILSSDGSLIAATFDTTVTIRNTSSRVPEKTIDCSHFRLSGVAFSPDCKQLALTSPEGAFRLWNLTTDEVHSFSNIPWYLKGWLRNVAKSSGTRWCASISNTGVQLRNYGTGAVLYTLQHAQRATAVLFSPDGSRMATSSKDKVIRVWSIETGNLIGQSGQFSHPVSAIEFFSNSRSLVSASNGTMSVWSIDTPEWTLQTKLSISASGRPWSNRTITKLAISPDDKLIVTAAETMVSTRFLKVWDVETRSLKTKFHDPTGPNSSLIFSPDGNRLAAICNDEKDLYIWDLNSGKLSVKVDNGNFWAGAPVFSPTGDLVASASNHGCLNIWRLRVY